MSVHAGQIVHVGGNNVIDRIQRAGLGDTAIDRDVIREVGNRKIVDRVPTEPDFTFTLETLDVSPEIEAWLTGQSAASLADDQGADIDDVAGTQTYKFSDFQCVNITSPWRAGVKSTDDTVVGGHIVPGYYVTRVRYAFGVTDNAGLTVDFAGGSYYYGLGAPVEQAESGDGIETEFVTDNAAIPHRIGGATGTTFKSVFGVIVNGELMTEGVDYTQSPSNTDVPGVATVTFTAPPANGAAIKFCYFTTAAQSFPQAVHASTVTKPAAVRGRHICAYLGAGGARQKVGGVQGVEMEGTVDSDVEREFCNEEIIGRTINGTDATGTLTVRAKNPAALIALLSKITGVASDEVIGYLNTNAIPLEVAILNPKNPAQTIKTLYMSDAVFDIPATPAAVNAPTDFVLRFASQTGDFTVYKGAKP